MFEDLASIPDGQLRGVASVYIRDESDIQRIPEGGGCYWLWTDEPVNHSMHRQKTPARFRGGEVIYNGLAKDNIRWRISSHLLGVPQLGWSGISLDILQMGHVRSHRKKAMSPDDRAKVPYVDGEPVTELSQLRKLRLSLAERDFIRHHPNRKIFYFRNGIDVRENKHKHFRFRVCFINSLKSRTYVGLVEKLWREKYGLPRLCSYSAGR
jgi:hypothetical protein